MRPSSFSHRAIWAASIAAVLLQSGALARTPFASAARSSPLASGVSRDTSVRDFLGARVKNIVGPGEVSAHGLAGEIGVVLVQVPADSAAGKAGLQEDDVILRCLDQEIRSVDDLFKIFRDVPKGTRIRLDLWRLQQHACVEVSTP